LERAEVIRTRHEIRNVNRIAAVVTGCGHDDASRPDEAVEELLLERRAIVRAELTAETEIHDHRLPQRERLVDDPGDPVDDVEIIEAAVALRVAHPLHEQ